jgi:type IV pilus assembly protein PilB
MIGQILVEQELISRKQLDESLDVQKEDRVLLGEILVRAQYITREQLDRALLIQKENRKKRLGQILVELKYLTPDDICLALASQLGCAWIDLSSLTIPEDVLGLLPCDVVQKYEVVPVERKFGELLIVASAQPRNEEMRRAVAEGTTMRTEFVIAYDGHIAAALEKYYGFS